MAIRDHQPRVYPHCQDILFNETQSLPYLELLKPPSLMYACTLHSFSGFGMTRAAPSFLREPLGPVTNELCKRGALAACARCIRATSVPLLVGAHSIGFAKLARITDNST